MNKFTLAMAGLVSGAMLVPMAAEAQAPGRAPVQHWQGDGYHYRDRGWHHRPKWRNVCKWRHGPRGRHRVCYRVRVR